MHLPDRCSCNWLRVELDKQVTDGPVEFGLDGGNGELS